jgi:hypothetical protein
MSWFSEHLRGGINGLRNTFNRPESNNTATQWLTRLGIGVPAIASGLGAAGLFGLGSGAAGTLPISGTFGQFTGAAPGVVGGAATTAGNTGIASLLTNAARNPALRDILGGFLQNGGVGVLAQLLQGDPEFHQRAVELTPEERALYDWVGGALGPRPTQGMPTLNYIGPIIQQLLGRFGSSSFSLPNSPAIPGIPGSGGRPILGGSTAPLDFGGIPTPWQTNPPPVAPAALPTAPRPLGGMPAQGPLQDALMMWMRQQQPPVRY